MTKPLGQLSQSEKTEKPEKRETYWTPTEKESLKETYGTEILVENGSVADVMTKEAPTDASIVTYTVDGKEHQEFFAKFMKVSIITSIFVIILLALLWFFLIY